MNKNEIINELRDDNEYYHGKGRDYLSASDINGILDGTYTKEIVDQEWKSHFEIGKMFHVQTLEPEKLGKFKIKDVKRRMAGEEFIKRSEAEMVAKMKLSHDADVTARGLLYGPGVEYEVPNIVDIEGIPFKGKADCLNPQLGWCVDLKSTSRIDFFNESIKKWYVAQLWCYYKIFGLPTAYIVVDKKTLETKVIYPPKHFYAQGKALVLEAIQKYKDHYLNV